MKRDGGWEDDGDTDASIWGKVKIWQLRLVSYISVVSFAMVFYLYIIESPFGLKWYYWFLFIFIVVVVVMVVDIFHVFPETQRYTWRKNPEFMKLKKTVNQNRKMLRGIMKHLRVEDETD